MPESKQAPEGLQPDTRAHEPAHILRDALEEISHIGGSYPTITDARMIANRALVEYRESLPSARALEIRERVAKVMQDMNCQDPQLLEGILAVISEPGEPVCWQYEDDTGAWWQMDKTFLDTMPKRFLRRPLFTSPPRDESPTEHKRWVDQAGPHDCFTACLASLTGLPHNDFPDPPEVLEIDAERAYGKAVKAHLISNGWMMHGTGAHPPKGYAVASGPSPRDLRLWHCVVTKDGEMVHDPHPDKAGLKKAVEYEVVIPLMAEIEQSKPKEGEDDGS